MASTMHVNIIRTSDTNLVKVIVTAIQIKNDINGNPRSAVQVWIYRDDHSGNLWSPIIKGYRKTKDDQYIIQCSPNDGERIERFIMDFENVVRHV